MNSKDYIEERARKQLKMIKPGEILYVLPDDGSPSDENTGEILTEEDQQSDE